MNTAARAGLGVLIGLALGAAMIYGLTELADSIVEHTHGRY